MGAFGEAPIFTGLYLIIFAHRVRASIIIVLYRNIVAVKTESKTAFLKSEELHYFLFPVHFNTSQNIFLHIPSNHGLDVLSDYDRRIYIFCWLAFS